MTTTSTTGHAEGELTNPTKTFGGTGREWAQAMASCLQDAGWDVAVDEDGQLQGTHTVEQDDAYLAATNTCYADVGQNIQHKLTPEQLHIMYQHEIVTIQCLADHGYPPSGDPPTEEEYVANYYNGGWYAWSVVPDDVGPSQWDALNRSCPQVPQEASDW